MSNKIRPRNAVERSGALNPIQSIQGTRAAKLTPAALLFAGWQGKVLPQHIQAYLEMAVAKHGKTSGKKLPPKAAMRAAIKAMPKGRTEALVASTVPRVMQAQAIALILRDPHAAGRRFDLLHAQGKISKRLKDRLFASLRGEAMPGELEPVTLETLLGHADHQDLHNMVSLAEFMLAEQQITFDIIEKNWNDSMREEEKASIAAQKRSQAQQAQLSAQAKEVTEQRAAYNRAALSRLAQALDVARLQMKNLMRHRWTTQPAVIQSSVSAAPVGTSAASAMDSTQLVSVVQDGQKTTMRVRVTPPAIDIMKALARPSAKGGAYIGMNPRRLQPSD